VFVAAAFCPHPPLLVPALACGAGAELDGLRAACDRAVRWLLDTRPQRVLVLGCGQRARLAGRDAVGSLAGYGVPVRAGFGPDADVRGPTAVPTTVPTTVPAAGPGLPLSLTIGGWLLTRAGGHLAATGVEVGPAGDLPPLDAGGRVGLLVLGDGSARRTESSPGYLDPRGTGFDAEVAAVLGGGDPDALAGLDLALGAELLAAGVPAWRAAGALLAGTCYAAELCYHAAPYGVGYFVACWERAGDAEPTASEHRRAARPEERSGHGKHRGEQGATGAEPAAGGEAGGVG
jgi:hypothetical protein